MNKKVIIIILILIVVAGAGLYIKSKKGDKAKLPVKQEDKQQPPPVVKDVDKSQLPEGFVAGFPIEEGAEVTANYTASQDNKTQATRVFVSKKTLQQNFDLYKKYLTDNKWTIVGTSNEVNTKSISATGPDQQNVQVLMSKNLATSQNLVTITFVTGGMKKQ